MGTEPHQRPIRKRVMKDMARKIAVYNPKRRSLICWVGGCLPIEIESPAYGAFKAGSALGDKDSMPVGEKLGGDLWPMVGRGQNEVISQKEETYVSLSLRFEQNVQ